MQLNLKDFSRKLKRYHSSWQFSECNAIFKIDWERFITRKPDLSQILKVLEIPELVLLISSHLDLRSVESLRQVSRHLRNMQLLTTVGDMRLRRILHRAIGIKRDERQTNRLIKEFNDLLRATGSIIGGSPVRVSRDSDVKRGTAV